MLKDTNWFEVTLLIVYVHLHHIGDNLKVEEAEFLLEPV